MKIISLLLIIGSGVLYQVFAKGTSPEINSYFSLMVTYSFAFLLSAVLYLLTKSQPLHIELSNINLSSLLLGAAIFVYEIGFILAYRNDYSISTLYPLASIAIMILLVVVGFIFYKDKITLTKILGVLIAVIGIYLMNK